MSLNKNVRFETLKLLRAISLPDAYSHQARHNIRIKGALIYMRIYFPPRIHHSTERFTFKFCNLFLHRI